MSCHFTSVFSRVKISTASAVCTVKAVTSERVTFERVTSEKASLNVVFERG